MNRIEKAFQFALAKHEGQYRKGTKAPYITHPFAVAMILKHHRFNDAMIAAGLLHDTLEDTTTTEEELLQVFGQEVLTLVQAASETDTALPWEERKRHTIEELAFKNTDELAVIAADKLHNIRSIQEDVQSIGENIWARFNRGKREQSWYYMSIVNKLESFKEDIRLIRILDAEVKRLFIGTGRLTEEKIDALFGSVYHLSSTAKTTFKAWGMLEFVVELKEEAELLYQKQDFTPLEPLMNALVERGVKFEFNSDGPFILLAFCYELQYRLGWSYDDMYFHLERNLSKRSSMEYKIKRGL